MIDCKTENSYETLILLRFDHVFKKNLLLSFFELNNLTHETVKICCCPYASVMIASDLNFHVSCHSVN